MLVHSDPVAAVESFFMRESISGPLVLGYSGGSDSTCLLHVLHRLNIDCVAAHLHHGQRSEADKEMHLCEAFAEELGVPFAAGRADVPVIARHMKIGLEEAGRHARYEFLRKVALQLGANWIATAHTRDDHVETVLLNITRGAGLKGLGGIRANTGEIVRPLLQVDRHATREYCASNGLWFHDDPANTDVGFARARVRSLVVPELERINPEVRTAIERLATIADAEDRFLNAAASALMERAEAPANGVLEFLTSHIEARFDAGVLRHAPTVLLKRGIRLVVSYLGADLDYAQSDATVSGLVNATRGSVTAEGGHVVCEWSPEYLDIRRMEPPPSFRQSLDPPGELTSDELGWRLTVETASPSDLIRERYSLRGWLDAGSIQGSLHVKNIQSGDQMQMVGAELPRRILDLLTGLSQLARMRLPILCDVVGPIWVPTVGVADRVKITDNSTRAFAVRLGTARPEAEP
jgi:tRNA(Ile)-lysidine synthase